MTISSGTPPPSRRQWRLAHQFLRSSVAGVNPSFYSLSAAKEYSVAPGESTALWTSFGYRLPPLPPPLWPSPIARNTHVCRVGKAEDGEEAAAAAAEAAAAAATEAEVAAEEEENAEEAASAAAAVAEVAAEEAEDEGETVEAEVEEATVVVVVVVQELEDADAVAEAPSLLMSIPVKDICSTVISL
jgi:hypothetical protein